MAFESNLVCITTVAGSDLSAHQYHFMVIGSDEEISEAGNTVHVDGVLQNKPVSGAAATLAISGISRVVLGAEVHAGDLVMSDASGKAVRAAAGQIAGKALESGVAGDVIPVLLMPSGEATHA